MSKYIGSRPRINISFSSANCLLTLPLPQTMISRPRKFNIILFYHRTSLNWEREHFVCEHKPVITSLSIYNFSPQHTLILSILKQITQIHFSLQLMFFLFSLTVKLLEYVIYLYCLCYSSTQTLLKTLNLASPKNPFEK